MKTPYLISRVSHVAPREGRVSRNILYATSCNLSDVAPREGRVSRNVISFAWLR